MEILAKAGSDVNALNSINETPLMLAVKKANNHKILTELVRLGANTEIRDERKNTSLLLAARQGKAEAVKSLINSKANIKATNTDGESIIHEATKSDDINTLKTAIELWPSKDIDLINHNKRTPLQTAARRTAVNSFKTLIEAGADYSKTIGVQKYNSYLSPFKFLSRQKILNDELLEWVVSKNISLASFYEYDVVKCFNFLHKSPGGVFDGLTQFIMSDSTLDSLTNTLIKEPRIYQVSIHAHNFAKHDFIEKGLFLFTVNRVCKKIRREKEFSSDQHIYEIYSAISQNLLTDLSSKKCISLNEIIDFLHNP